MTKSLVAAFVAVAFSAGAFAQASAPSGKMSPPSAAASAPMKAASGMKAEKKHKMKKEKGASAPM